jgi:hypothetical protein
VTRKGKIYKNIVDELNNIRRRGLIHVLYNDEIVVYKEDQITIKYLVELQ